MKSISNALLVLLGLALAIGATAGEKTYKPWTEWSMKDADKILNDSAWGQVQTDTDITEMTYSPASRPVTSQGAINQATGWNFRIRFLSARPIREAFARQAELDPGRNPPEAVKALRAFAERNFEDTIVVAVQFDGRDGRFTGPVFQAFTSAITNTLKNNTYLELKGGKRLFLQEYEPFPGKDGLGAKFIFSRIVDGKPFLDAKSGDIRFWAEFPGKSVTLNMRYKIADMVYRGVLEY
jgi:hypothetical protein